MPPEDEEPQPDMRTNLLKARKVSAATTADGARSALTGGGGNPLRSVLATLDTAWVSPSTERRHYEEDLEGLGQALADAFSSQADSCRAEAAAEPAEVDADDPHDGWKASSAVIDARGGGYRNRFVAI